jgi:hypothetical protein
MPGYGGAAENTLKGGLQGLEKVGGKLIDAGTEAVKNPVSILNFLRDTSIPGMAVNNAKNTYSEHIVPALAAWHDTREKGGSLTDAYVAADAASREHDALLDHAKKVYEDFQKNPTQATARGLVEIGTGLLAAYAVGGNPEEEAAGAETVAPKSPGIIQELRQGKEVAQPLGQNAVRSGVSSAATKAGTVPPAADTPILKGNSTVLDDPLSALSKNEKAAYKTVDDAVGFDLKAEKQQLSNDQYKLSQLGNTDADINTRGNLIEAINDSESRIAEAEGKLKTAGIDPKVADTIHQQRMAGMDFKKALVSSSAPDGSSIDVDKLLNASKLLRFNKFGDRISQFMGGDANADAYMEQLQKAQAAGVHAMKTQAIVKAIAHYAVPGAVGLAGLAGGAYELLK